ncbi:hypothetical protein Tco_0590522 [Tanacetum coccineum]
MKVCNRGNEIYGMDEEGILKFWYCYLDGDRKSIKADGLSFPKFLLEDYKPRPKDYPFKDWLLTKVGHTKVSEIVKRALLKRWLIDCFQEELVKDPRSRSFDDYKWMFDLELDQLADEYELGIGKKVHMLDDIWKNCKKVQGDNTFWCGQSFICVTKELMDALPLGRENGLRFREMICKEVDSGRKVHRKTFSITTCSAIPRLKTAEDLGSDDLLLHDAEMEVMNMILLSIPNEIYNSVDACTSAKDMWKRVEPLVSVYNRFAQLMNDLQRNNMNFPTVTINTKFLNSLQPEWLKYVTQVRLAKQLTLIRSNDIFDYLQQFEKLVNASRAKKLEKSHDPLALVAHTGSSSRQTSSYYVTSYVCG